LPTSNKARSLPDSTFHQNLGTLALYEINANHHRPSTSIGIQLQHLDRLTSVKMEYLVRTQTMHLAEGIRL
jgi:hypothetical protein